MPSRRGMNLLEITIVLLMIGVMAAVATPRFTQSVRVNRLRAAATELSATIDYVRHVAMNEGRTTALVFNASADSIFSTDTMAPGQIGSFISIDLHADFDDSIELTADFDSHATLSFDLEGVPIAGGSGMQAGTITLTSEGEVLTLTVAPGLGTTTFTTSGGDSSDAGDEYGGSYSSDADPGSTADGTGGVNNSSGDVA